MFEVLGAREGSGDLIVVMPKLFLERLALFCDGLVHSGPPPMLEKPAALEKTVGQARPVRQLRRMPKATTPAGVRGPGPVSEAIRKIVEDAKAPITAGEIAKEMLRRKVPTASKNLAGLVGVLLRNNVRGIECAGRSSGRGAPQMWVKAARHNSFAQHTDPEQRIKAIKAAARRAAEMDPVERAEALHRQVREEEGA